MRINCDMTYVSKEMMENNRSAAEINDHIPNEIKEADHTVLVDLQQVNPSISYSAQGNGPLPTTDSFVSQPISDSPQNAIAFENEVQNPIVSTAAVIDPSEYSMRIEQEIDSHNASEPSNTATNPHQIPFPRTHTTTSTTTPIENITTTPIENINTTEQQDQETQISLFGELRNLYNRCHYSLPFIILFIVHFAYEHTSGILIFVSGTFAIIGLDQRLRTQIDRKENSSLFHLICIILLCVLDIFAICCVNGDPNPHRQFRNNLYLHTNTSKNLKDKESSDVLFWEVLGAILVNDFIVRLCSIVMKAVVTACTLERWSFITATCQNSTILCQWWSCLRVLKRSLKRSVHRTETTSTILESSVIEDANVHDQDEKRSYEHSWRALYYRRRRKLFAIIEMLSIFIRSAFVGFPWCIYYQMGTRTTQSFADVMTFAYIFMKALVLGAQAQNVLALARSFLNPKLDYGEVATEEDMAEAGSPDCSICFENMSCPIRLPCAHLFCEECVAEWLDREHSCPLCRASVISGASNQILGLDAAAPQIHQPKPRYLDGSTSLFPQLL